MGGEQCGEVVPPPLQDFVSHAPSLDGGLLVVSACLTNTRRLRLHPTQPAIARDLHRRSRQLDAMLGLAQAPTPQDEIRHS
jgi:hypothetical protein